MPPAFRVWCRVFVEPTLERLSLPSRDRAELKCEQRKERGGRRTDEKKYGDDERRCDATHFSPALSLTAARDSSARDPEAFAEGRVAAARAQRRRRSSSPYRSFGYAIVVAPGRWPVEPHPAASLCEAARAGWHLLGAPSGRHPAPSPTAEGRGTNGGVALATRFARGSERRSYERLCGHRAWWLHR